MIQDKDYKAISEFLDDKECKRLLKNPVMVDPNNTNSRAMSITPPFALVRPHNLRRQIKVLIAYNSPKRIGLSAIHEENKHNKIITVRSYEKQQILLQLGKDKLTAIYMQKEKGSKKETYVVKGSRKQIDSFVELKRNEIKGLLDYYLLEFLRGHGIEHERNSVEWSQKDFWIKVGTEKLNLSEDMGISTEHFFKSYKEGTEVRTKEEEEDTKIVNHIHNSMLIDLEPELVKELDILHDNLKSLKLYFNPLRFLKEHIKNPLDVLKYKNIVTKLTLSERADLSDYMFGLV